MLSGSFIKILHEHYIVMLLYWNKNTFRFFYQLMAKQAYVILYIYIYELWMHPNLNGITAMKNQYDLYQFSF